MAFKMPMSALDPQAMALLPAAQELAAKPVLHQVARSHQSPKVRNRYAAIMKHPVLSGVATGQTTVSSTEPIDGHPIQRSPNTRHNLVGFGAVAVTGGVPASIAATSYSPFVASRVVFSAVTIMTAATPSTVGAWKVGSKSQFASIGNEPLGLFAASLNGGRIRFNRAAPSISVSAAVQFNTSVTVYAALIGTAGGRKNNNRPPPQYAKEDRVAIPNTTIAPGASQTIAVTPTRKFWGTKIILDDNLVGTYGLSVGTGASLLAFSDILVGSDSQLMSAPPLSGGATPYVPAGIFNGLYSPEIDLDRADTAVPISFEVLNVGSVTATFGGVILGDTDRRADVESDDADAEPMYG